MEDIELLWVGTADVGALGGHESHDLWALAAGGRLCVG